MVARKGFIMLIAFSLRERGRTHVTYYLSGAGPENSRLFKVTFLGKIKTAIKPGIKSRFSVMDFSMSDSMWAYSFLFNHYYSMIYL